MGFRDALNSTTEKLKINGPDLTTVANVYRSSYDLGRDAVSKVDSAVRVDGAEKLKEYMPDSETREKIARILKKVGIVAADVSINELLKGIKGSAQIIKIVLEELKDQPGSHSVHHDSKISEHHPNKLKEMQQKIETMQDELNNINSQYKKLDDRIKELESHTPANSPNQVRRTRL